MSTTPVPRLVGATWYPVPCPEGVPLTLGFPSEEACQSFCEAIGPVLDAHQDALVALEDKHADELNATTEAEYDRGWDGGHEEGYDLGFEAGINEGLNRALARSAESA